MSSLRVLIRGLAMVAGLSSLACLQACSFRSLDYLHNGVESDGGARDYPTFDSLRSLDRGPALDSPTYDGPAAFDLAVDITPDIPALDVAPVRLDVGLDKVADRADLARDAIAPDRGLDLGASVFDGAPRVDAECDAEGDAEGDAEDSPKDDAEDGPALIDLAGSDEEVASGDAFGSDGPISSGGTAGSGGVASSGGAGGSGGMQGSGGKISTGGNTGGSSGLVTPPPPPTLPGAECTLGTFPTLCNTAGSACYMYCGFENQGYRSATCSNGQIVTGPCTIPSTTNFACYALDSVAACGASPPTASTNCTRPACQPCGSGTGTGYYDTNGSAKVGYCVCSSGKWSCTSPSSWPCPGRTGC